MNHRVVALLALMTVPGAQADEITRVELGEQVLRVSQPLNSVFARQTVTLAALCRRDCQDKSVHWEVLAPRLATTSAPPDSWLFASGIAGIAIQVSVPGESPRASLQQPVTLQVGLVRTAPQVSAGLMALTRPLLRWRLVSHHGGEAAREEARGQLVVVGSLTAGSCEPQTGTLRFTPGEVRLAELRRIAPGQPLTTGGDSQSIEVACTPGVARSLSARFLARTLEGKPTIMRTDNDGVGFMMVDGRYRQVIRWDESQPLVYPVPESGQTRIPLTVYYTPTGQAVAAGKVTAQARFTIDYQ